MCVRETHNTQDWYAVAVRVQNRAFIHVILSTVCSALLASLLITFSSSLFANAIACDGIAVDSGPLGSGSPSFIS